MSSIPAAAHLPRVRPTGRFLGLKAALASVLCHPVVGRVLTFIFAGRIPHRGARIRIVAGGDPRLAAHLFWGMYESAEIRFVDQFVSGGTDVIELGSSIGGVACRIARRLEHDDRLVCVEANPRAVEALAENLKTNVHDCRVQLVHGALSYDGTPVVKLSLGQSTLVARLGTTGATCEVPAVTLASVIQSAGIDSYVLVCDIEGAEVALLDCDRHLLKQCQTLVIELHAMDYKGTSYSPDDLVAKIQHEIGMNLVARYGEVCAFVR